ncbi:MAG: hypothetical protein M1274_01970 [Actinobacteria bacterium]|nr:hypothetical protein [Actinomycetota bacterium]
MELRSKGLGKKSVTMCLGEAEVTDTGKAMVVSGKMGAPVYWEYTITMTEQDLVDILGIVSKKGTASFFLGCENKGRVVKAAIGDGSKLVFGVATGIFRKSDRRSAASDVTGDMSATTE